jgi:chromosome segregation ATPase
MISQAATELLESLKQIIPHLDVLDEASTKAAAAKSLLDSTLKELDQAKAALKATSDEHREVTELLRNKRQVLDDERARALRDVQKQIADAQAKLASLEEMIGKKQSDHDAIIASMNSLAKRLNLA